VVEVHKVLLAAQEFAVTKVAAITLERKVLAVVV
jgi:hypothetical protein